ncbi:hypothetical protein [Leptospira bandrabouensis]|uniref:Uncharacterized protein n=1 Tax=Leptospira bandrabouensis TaxID=2484903 RepID=A0A6H3NN94_9LEPT|nr:hypothetical protein [Leptospira bandrabouensis]TGN07439.1 hypothetical protein EHR07_04775 [Leptospira bandrabouensis]TGN12816.1 hypothetical protein EHR08_15830 [Leptospira bandrabouensis]
MDITQIAQGIVTLLTEIKEAVSRPGTTSDPIKVDIDLQVLKEHTEALNENNRLLAKLIETQQTPLKPA